jgi:hypothetical protein
LITHCQILKICSSTYKNIKNKKSYKYALLLIIDGDSNFMQCLVLQVPSKIYIICNGYNLTVVDGLSNDNEIP